MSRAVLLVGHGSVHDRDSSAPVYAHAERLRARRLFAEVQVAFWKEPPYLREALSLVEADDVYVVPMFLADGWYTRAVVPRELGLDGKLTRRGTRRVRYCPPVGTSTRMPRLVLQRACETARLTAAERRDAALVVIGHGTERSPTSAYTARRIAANLRDGAGFGVVACGFLDEEPAIARVVDAIAARHIVLVPLFLAEGYHTRTTIPHRLGLGGEHTQRAGRTLWYTRPVGTMPEVTDIVVQLVRAAQRARGGRGRETEGGASASSPVTSG